MIEFFLTNCVVLLHAFAVIVAMRLPFLFHHIAHGMIIAAMFSRFLFIVQTSFSPAQIEKVVIFSKNFSESGLL